jgi:hypothetical protein
MIKIKPKMGKLSNLWAVRLRRFDWYSVVYIFGIGEKCIPNWFFK